MPSPRIYFVLTLRGQVGPFDRTGLRNALADGDIQGSDQVRTAGGKPLGPVNEVLQRSSDRMARTGEHAALQHVPQPAGWWSGPVPYIIIVLVGIVLVLVMMRHDLGEPASGPAPSPTVAPSPQPQASPPSLPQVTPPATTILQRLLPGRSGNQWMTGDGSQVREGDVPGSFRIGFPERGAWACIDLDEDLQNLDRGVGLALEVVNGQPALKMTMELIEPSGERFLAGFSLPPAGQRWVRVPWSAFTRRDWQPDGAASDGLQRSRIKALSLWKDDEAARSVTFASIGIY